MAWGNPREISGPSMACRMIITQQEAGPRGREAQTGNTEKAPSAAFGANAHGIGIGFAVYIDDCRLTAWSFASKKAFFPVL